MLTLQKRHVDTRANHTVHWTWSLLQFGCLVVNAPTANTIAAAEHGIALLCALTRNVAQADASVKQVSRTVVVQYEVGELHTCHAVWNMAPTMPRCCCCTWISGHGRLTACSAWRLQSKWERKKYVGVSLVDKTLAIIGFGKVQWRSENSAAL